MAQVSIYHLGQYGKITDSEDLAELKNNVPVSYFTDANITLYNYETMASHGSDPVIGRSGPILTYSSVANSLKIAFQILNTNVANGDQVNVARRNNAALEGLTNLLYPVYDNDMASRVIAPPICEMIVDFSSAEISNNLVSAMANRRMVGYIKEFSYNFIKNTNINVVINNTSEGTQVTPTTFDVSLTMDLIPDRTRGLYYSGTGMKPVNGTFMNPTDYANTITNRTLYGNDGKKPPTFGS